jgi:enoyl-CoA hydratase/carnithine racemase
MHLRELLEQQVLCASYSIAQSGFGGTGGGGEFVMAGRYNTIAVEKRGEVEWLTLNRPDALNAITTEMAGELNDYFGALYHDRSTRIVVLRGAGRAFCAGLDIKDHGSRDPAAVPFGGGFGFQGFLADVYIKMRRCPQPIIALVHGAACGGGFAFALASDIRIAVIGAGGPAAP